MDSSFSTPLANVSIVLENVRTMANRKTDPILMKAGEEAFWKEFDELDRPEERYYVVDKATGEIIVQNARLTKEKKKIRV